MKFILSLFCFTLNFFLYAQPDESWKLFDDSHTARVDITIDSASLSWIYSNVQSDSEHVAKFHFKNNWIDESVDSVGFRLRGNTSRDAQKKSFKISFNTFIKGRDFYNVEKLNLNGEHNDPSIIRSKLCFDLFKSIGMKASRANHVKVYINEEYYGLYINVEHIDEEFLKKNYEDDSGNLWKCLYPADLIYLGNNPDTYANLKSGSRPVYELHTNEQDRDFSKLVRLIDLLNNTPFNIIPDSIESVIDISEVLKYFAVNILTGSWDDYWSLMNNYYLYHEPKTDLFHLIPYDYDNTFGIDWFNIDWSAANPYNFPKVAAGQRPLAEKLLANAQYRNLYTHFLEFIRDSVYALHYWESRIDSIKNMITAAALSDNFRSLDWGFSTSDFFNSYSASAYSNQHVKFGLKQFINLRNNSLANQLSYIPNAKPIVYKINYEPQIPKPEDSINVYVSAFSKTGIKNILIQFINATNGYVVNYPMNYSPKVNTKNVDDADRYIGKIPPLGANGSGVFTIYIEDSLNQSQIYPKKVPINIKVSNASGNSAVINEFLADNLNSYPDPNGEHDDWIELYNPFSSAVLLSGKYLTDKIDNLVKWKFPYPEFYLYPGEYITIYCDENSSQPGFHTNFKLSKNGEFIAFTDSDGVTILDSITFGQQKTDTSYGRFPSGSSSWVFMSPTPGSDNILTSITEKSSIPVEFKLEQNYPNPFNPKTKIKFRIPETDQHGEKGIWVKLIVYDVLGNEVEVLVNQSFHAGSYEVDFSPKSNIASGIYFYQLIADKYVETKKMILLR